MKRLSIYIVLISVFLTSCDKDFEEININPVLPSKLDASFLFADAQVGTDYFIIRYESQITQQIITPFTGVLQGGNHNVWFEANNTSAPFDMLYPRAVKHIVDAIENSKGAPEKSNLYNMARIMKAFIFQRLVDTYGDVPYTEAGKAFLTQTYLPKYDNALDIYNDLLKEVSEATVALDATKPLERNDNLYRGDIARWKRFGNSLLLRIAMRFTKVDAAKASQFAKLAVDPARGGVMLNNADNAFFAYNAIIVNANTGQFHGGERANYYLAKPFVDHLKSTQDPRIRSISVKYAIPANPLASAGAENTTPADQDGMPVGYNENTISTAPGFPGRIGAAWRYSQVNRRIVGKIDAPGFLITHSQTQLLLAEAAQRGFITGNVRTFYEEGVRAHMAQMTQYDASAVISAAEQNAYLTLNPFDPAKALEQINTQYWISSFLIGSEAWCNFRRSGFPALRPNTYINADPVVANGFIRRLHYPAREYSVNPTNLAAAVARQGADNMATRIFWDK